MMPAAPDSSTLVSVLPGTWGIAATNFPKWLSGMNRETSITYELVTAEPLVFAEIVQYTDEENEFKQVAGVDSWAEGDFIWRGRGRLRFAPRRWSVAGVSDDGTIVVLRFAKSLTAQAGLDIIVREGHSYPELRRMVAHESQSFGLSSEDFASLSWFDPDAPVPATAPVVEKRSRREH
jgi:hypothetical protein